MIDLRVTPGAPDPLVGAKTVVFGVAREGTALAKYLTRVGAKVTLSDAKSAVVLGETLRPLAELPVHLVLGGNRPRDAVAADIVFVSPGVPLTTPAVTAAREAGVPIWSEPLLFVTRCPAPIIGVTGSSGKTTTTSLIGAMLNADGRRRVWIGGNIGTPLLTVLDAVRADDLCVMELSSFQLEVFTTSPHISVVTNLSPDHLDRHASLAEYYGAKRRIVAHQRRGDIAVLNADDPHVRAFADGIPSDIRWFSLNGQVDRGAHLDGDTLVLAGPPPIPLLAAREIPLRGRHNVANVLAAAAAAFAAGADPTAIVEAARTFRGTPHRLELVGVVNGVSYYNDSIATTMVRAMAALSSFAEPIIWLVGGRDKNLVLTGASLDHSVVAPIRRVRRAICFGESAEAFAAVARAAGASVVEVVGPMAEAVERARQVAEPGDVVLLSPAGTSFDEFRDYTERGAAFRALVQQQEVGP